MAATTLTVKLARECLPLFQDARRHLVVFNPAVSYVTDSAALNHALGVLGAYTAKNSIDWRSLMALPFDRFALPSAFNGDIRYRTSIDRVLIPALERFRDSQLRPCFEGEIYNLFVIRAALRGLYAVAHPADFSDVLIVGTSFVTSPAALNPNDFLCSSEELDALFPNGTNAPESLGE